VIFCSTRPIQCLCNKLFNRNPASWDLLFQHVQRSLWGQFTVKRGAAFHDIIHAAHFAWRAFDKIARHQQARRRFVFDPAPVRTVCGNEATAPPKTTCAGRQPARTRGHGNFERFATSPKEVTGFDEQVICSRIHVLVNGHHAQHDPVTAHRSYQPAQQVVGTFVHDVVQAFGSRFGWLGHVQNNSESFGGRP
jgi:hypothetical protein